MLLQCICLFVHIADLESQNLILYPPIYGAYTELYAGLSAEITEEKNASFGKTHDNSRIQT
jgi:hypothetical protein